MRDFLLGVMVGAGGVFALIIAATVGLWIWAFQDWRRVGAP